METTAVHSPWILIFLSIALGMLVGLQRESVDSKTAGIRTFPIVTLSGTLCGFLAEHYQVWVIAAGMIALAGLLVISNLGRIRSKEQDIGLTTEVAVLLMFALGAYLVKGDLAIAVVITGVVTVLLHFKSVLHGWVDRIGSKNLMGIMQFVLISMVILPVLPNETYDAYDSFNPRETWLMVVLIVGISLAGYFIYKLWGDKAGVLLGGILGGIISSTATTLSYAKKAKQSPGTVPLAAFVLVTATAVSLCRVMVEITVVAPREAGALLMPIALELAAMVVLVVILFIQNRKTKNTMPEQGNPAQLKSAIIFALLYAAVRFISEAAKQELGNDALYAVSFISGLTDLDAITLSTARMTNLGEIEASLGWRLILLAMVSNLIFKAGLAYVWGGRVLGHRVALLFGLLAVVAALLFFLWPGL